MIVLDASAMIAYLDSKDAHHQGAESLLTSHADEALGASTVTLAEVLVGPTRAGRLAETMAIFRELDIAEVGLMEGSAQRLAALRVATGLKLPDCCVLLAAETTGASVASFDDRLRAAAAIIGVPVLP